MVRHSVWWWVEFEVEPLWCLAHGRSSKTSQVNTVPPPRICIWALGFCEFQKLNTLFFSPPNVYVLLRICLGENPWISSDFPKALHGLWKVKTTVLTNSITNSTGNGWVEQRTENDLKISCPQLQLVGCTWTSTGHWLTCGSHWGPRHNGHFWSCSTSPFLASFSKQAHSSLFCLFQLSHYSVLSLIVKATLQGRKHYGVERLRREWKHHMFNSENKVRRWICEEEKKANRVTKAMQWQQY